MEYKGGYISIAFGEYLGQADRGDNAGQGYTVARALEIIEKEINAIVIKATD
ncbi:MAG: hypothetical protein PHD91_05140 [bacterium]|nr:hypothetical protein [bacterium]MDD4559100.1 hypothetical protein [bacterium]